MDYSKFLEDIERSLTIFALLIGGIVSWVKFVGGRADKVRLEPTVSGELIPDGDKSHLLLTLGLSNKGLFVAEVPAGGFNLEVLTPKPELESFDIQDTEWQTLSVFRVFANHNAIQTGESTSEQLRLTIGHDQFPALQFKLRVTHKEYKLGFLVIRQGTEWEAMTIISCKPTQNPLP